MRSDASVMRLLPVVSGPTLLPFAEMRGKPLSAHRGRDANGAKYVDREHQQAGEGLQQPDSHFVIPWRLLREAPGRARRSSGTAIRFRAPRQRKLRRGRIENPEDVPASRRPKRLSP